MNEQIKNILVNKLGIQNASDEKQSEMLEQIGLLVYQGSLIRAMESMRDEEVMTLEKMMDENKSPDEIFNFVKQNVANFDEIISEEAEKFISHANQVMSGVGQ